MSRTGIARGWAEAALEALARDSLLRELEALESPQGVEVRIDGRTLINFSSNDYLGLASDPALVQALRDAAEVHGVGSGASRLVVGDSTAHRALEAELAAFEGTEAAVLFNAGWAANVGVISSLLAPGDVVFSDALNHASIIDGCRLSKAQVVVYPHRDVAALASLMEAHPGRRRLLVTDSVFSMDGDVAPLEALVDLCERQQVAVMVDEAHATGVLGERGAGLVEALGLGDRVELRMGTLGKALGAFGAYVACSRPVADFLVNRARPLVFSTSLPPALCAAASAALRRVREDAGLRGRLWENIRFFATGLQRLGFPATPSSAIFPVELGDAQRALSAAAYLRARGLLVKAIRPPTVPVGTSRLRFALSAAHTTEHLTAALEGLGAWRRDADA